MTDREIAKQWMEKSKDDYLDECEDAADAREYLVEDCNEQAGTNLGRDELAAIALEVLP